MSIVESSSILEPGYVRSTTDSSELESTLRGLVDSWKRANGFSSSLTAMEAHPLHHAIILIGRCYPRETAQFLLRELRDSPYYYFTALREITGWQPAGEKMGLAFDEITALWLDEGRRRGLV